MFACAKLQHIPRVAAYPATRTNWSKFASVRCGVIMSFHSRSTSTTIISLPTQLFLVSIWSPQQWPADGESPRTFRKNVQHSLEMFGFAGTYSPTPLQPRQRPEALQKTTGLQAVASVSPAVVAAYVEATHRIAQTSQPVGSLRLLCSFCRGLATLFAYWDS